LETLRRLVAAGRLATLGRLAALGRLATLFRPVSRFRRGLDAGVSVPGSVVSVSDGMTFVEIGVEEMGVGARPAGTSFVPSRAQKRSSPS
jgi:hypothetical protein